jgi:hypothetical protein
MTTVHKTLSRNVGANQKYDIQTLSYENILDWFERNRSSVSISFDQIKSYILGILIWVLNALHRISFVFKTLLASNLAGGGEMMPNRFSVVVHFNPFQNMLFLDSYTMKVSDRI